MRKEFEQIIQGWNGALSMEDIPKRLKKIEELGDLHEDEHHVAEFMRNVQFTREKLRRKNG